jgi:hypothetical protein
VRTGWLLCVLFCLYSLALQAQSEKPLYLSVGYGSDQNLEKSDRILSDHPTFISLSIEKRLPQSEFYGLGLHSYHFTSVFEKYNHLSFRAYQHFGQISNASESNIDPYIGAFVGGENYQNSFKPSVGFFVGLRAMFTQMAGIHAEFVSVSSGFNSGILLQFGLTTCLMKNKNARFKKRGTYCPKGF